VTGVCSGRHRVHRREAGVGQDVEQGGVRSHPAAMDETVPNRCPASRCATGPPSA
jgi:hypothetical protein